MSTYRVLQIEVTNDTESKNLWIVLDMVRLYVGQRLEFDETTWLVSAIYPTTSTIVHVPVFL